jgi:betaine lipid synthase
MKHLNIGPDDSVMCITSAGCNALHYAVAAQPKRIHCVDLNPCQASAPFVFQRKLIHAQGHLFELKLAAISALDYDDFWKLFGDGKHPDFMDLLDSKLSPYLSCHAYQFWKTNANAFDSCFYDKGYSGHGERSGLARKALSHCSPALGQMGYQAEGPAARHGTILQC